MDKNSNEKLTYNNVMAEVGDNNLGATERSQANSVITEVNKILYQASQAAVASVDRNFCSLELYDSDLFGSEL